VTNTTTRESGGAESMSGIRSAQRSAALRLTKQTMMESRDACRRHAFRARGPSLQSGSRLGKSAAERLHPTSALAASVTERPSGSMQSSLMILPGCGGLCINMTWLQWYVTLGNYLDKRRRFVVPHRAFRANRVLRKVQQYETW